LIEVVNDLGGIDGRWVGGGLSRGLSSTLSDNILGDAREIFNESRCVRVEEGRLDEEWCMVGEGLVEFSEA
jgi:hypothetical protein